MEEGEEFQVDMGGFYWTKGSGPADGQNDLAQKSDDLSAGPPPPRFSASPPNVYRPPAVTPTVAEVEARVDELRDTPELLAAQRREHIRRESGVKAAGLFFVFSGTATFLFSIKLTQAAPTLDYSLRFIVVSLLCLVVVASAYVTTGMWIRQLQRRGRVLGLGLLGAHALLILVGALIQSPTVSTFLALAFVGLTMGALIGPKVRTIMSPRYRELVVPSTPEVQHRGLLAPAILTFMLLANIAVLNADVKELFPNLP